MHVLSRWAVDTFLFISLFKQTKNEEHVSKTVSQNCKEIDHSSREIVL